MFDLEAQICQKLCPIKVVKLLQGMQVQLDSEAGDGQLDVGRGLSPHAMGKNDICTKRNWNTTRQKHDFNQQKQGLTNPTGSSANKQRDIS